MITLTFSGTLNTSIQVGDSVFTSGGTTQSDEGFDISDFENTTNNTYSSSISYVGTINAITLVGGGYHLVVNSPTGTVPPAIDSFIFFSKNQDVNVSSIKGYYNAVKFKNNSKYSAELFAVSCGVTESSK